MKELTQQEQDQFLSTLASVRHQLQIAENHLRARNVRQAHVFLGRADSAMFSLRNEVSLHVTGKPIMLAETTEEG